MKQYFRSNQKMDTQVVKEMILPSITEDNVMEQYLVLSYPLEKESADGGSVIIYQSLEAVHRTTKEQQISYSCQRLLPLY